MFKGNSTAHRRVAESAEIPLRGYYVPPPSEGSSHTQRLRASMIRLGVFSRRRRGFTLVEVLVATVLLATGLLGALTAFSMASRVMGVATTDTTLTLLAQEKLADIEVLGREALAKAPTAGDFGADNPGYRWEFIVNDPDELNVMRVDVVIYAPKLGGTREVWFSTSVF